MIYKDFKGLKLSALGMGTMRLPTCEGDNSRIDRDAVRQMLDYAFSKGVNYIDTAWGYHSGNSESVLGELLEKYPRDSFYLATKFPGYDVANFEKVEEIFRTQLEKCRVDYFDFYLFHNVCEKDIDAYLDRSNGLMDFLLRQKAEGRIRNIGFSTHGSLETTQRFLDAYGEHMEFCQIQLNWLDWELQKAKDKVELLGKLNIPIWVMEPVRGGKLVNLAPEYEEKLRAMRPEATAVEWAFRFVQSVPGVTMTLSGMSNMTQLQENIETFSTEDNLTEKEFSALLELSAEMRRETTVPCTACRYCTDHCPMGLDIPKLIELYNEQNYMKGFLVPMVISSLPEEKRPSACIGCRGCEAVCPQNIKVSEIMTHFTGLLQK